MNSANTWSNTGSAVLTKVRNSMYPAGATPGPRSMVRHCGTGVIVTMALVTSAVNVVVSRRSISNATVILSSKNAPIPSLATILA